MVLMMKNKIWSAGLGIALAAGLFWSFPLTAGAAPVFPEGVQAEGRSLAGMTGQEATEFLQQYADSLAGQKITLTVEEKEVETTAGDLGFHWVNTDAAEKAAEEYAGGSLIRQYMTKKKLAESPVDLQLETEVDSGKVKEFIDAQCQGMTQEAKDASITREDGKFVITESEEGRTIDAAATGAALNEALAGGLEEPVKVAAVITRQEPAVSSEDLETIQDVLGTFTTDFSSSGAARSTNLMVGAAKINGHVLMPGEVLSGYECLQPFTTENGYKTAAAYENGQVVDSVGGGVCQIATTLYNAALRAEIEIVQRQNHSMIVGYVKPSMDSAIAGTYKDIKIKNNYSTPIYVEGYTSGKQLIFTIYGQETRPEGRQVEYISETIGSTDPGEPQLIVDNSLAPGARVKVQSAHTGLRSRLWKVVTVNGVEQERTLLNNDTYNASKAVYRVGPELPAAVPADAAQTEGADAASPETAGTSEAPATGVNGGPGVSAPSQTEEPGDAAPGDSGAANVQPIADSAPADNGAAAAADSAPADNGAAADSDSAPGGEAPAEQPPVSAAPEAPEAEG